MNKLILALVFILFFSGKPNSKNTCGPTLYIWHNNSTYPYYIYQIDVINHTTGLTTTYNDPGYTNPLTHNDQGGHIEVKFYLNADEQFTMYSMSSSGECNREYFHSTWGSISFNAYCDFYDVFDYRGNGGGCP